MIILMLNPVWLKTFITLIDTGHFTKTAEKLFMTQPGVSQHINKLESTCGHSLIARNKKSFEVTEQGRLVYQYAQQLSINEDDLLEQLAFDNAHAGQCSLACSGALALMLYPKLLNLQAQHSQLVVKLKAAPNEQILNEVQTGTIDIGIVTNMPNHSLFEVKEIGQEQLCLVFPANVNIEKYGENLLNKLGLIKHPDAEHYLALYFAQSQQANFTHLNINDIPVTGFINQISQILEPVAKGLGFTILPKSVIDNFHTPKQLTIFTPPKPVLETLYLVKKRNRALPARFTTIKAVLKQHFASTA